METQGRRSLLKTGLAGTALLALAGTGIALQGTRAIPTRGGRKLVYFSPEEFTVISAFSARVLAFDTPAGVDAANTGGVPAPLSEALQRELSARPAAPSPADVDVAGKMDEFLSLLEPQDKKELKQLIGLFENALFSLASGLAPIPFTRKSPAQQDEHLANWAHSRLAVKRTGYQALKRLSCAMYFSSPETYASLGYPGPPVELVRSVLDARKATP